jgi:hypothetical protein
VQVFPFHFTLFLLLAIFPPSTESFRVILVEFVKRILERLVVV